MTELNKFFKDFAQHCDKCNSVICSCQEENPIDKWINKFHLGNAMELANQLPDESIDMIITSPPYFQLRSYLPKGHPDKEKEIGSETDPYEYINNLVKLFNVLKRKLKKSGTCWVNIGDVYFGGSGGPQSFERNANNIKWYDESNRNPHRRDKSKYDWMQPKQLMLIPSRFAILMQEFGWILRNDLIWKKENAMPTSVNDRFKPSYEHIFFFAKSRHYFFDLNSIREPHKSSLKSLQNRINYDTERRGGKLQEGELGTGQWSTNKRQINPLGRVPADSWKYSEHENEGQNTKALKERLAYARNVEGMEHDSAINHPMGKTPEDVIKYETGYEGGRKLRKSPNDAFHPAGKTPSDVYDNFTKNPEGMKRLNTLSTEEKMHPLGGTPDDFFSINTEPHPFAHFAVYPVKLIEAPIKAGCPKEICSKCGTPRFPITTRIGGPQGDHTKFMNDRYTEESKKTEHSFDASGSTLSNRYLEFGYPEYKIDYTKCNCKNNYFVGGIVLDPFIGSGSTAIACEIFRRRWIGFELNDDYIKIAEQRLAEYKKQKEFFDIEDYKNLKSLQRDAVKTKPLMEFLNQKV